MSNQYKYLRGCCRVSLPSQDVPFNPKEFFKTREGLYIWDGFRDRVLAVAVKIGGLPEEEILVYELAREANDTQVRDNLPSYDVFENASQFCAYLAGILLRQRQGEEGTLLNDGRFNLFCVRGIMDEIFVVIVYWLAEWRLWHVRAHALDVNRWGVGFRVFSFFPRFG
jgi:hypothetical protein